MSLGQVIYFNCMNSTGAATIDMAIGDADRFWPQKVSICIYLCNVGAGVNKVGIAFIIFNNREGYN